MVKTLKKKVLIALSGGIDSAVSAYLLIKQGYEVEAAFMKNWSSTAGLLKSECPWLIDRQDALRAAAFLRIPLHTLDFEKQYQRTVMKYFFDAYKKGLTPNPDVMCNKEIKFKFLYNWAMKNGFDYLATGHYARINTTPSASRPPLLGRRGSSAVLLGNTAELSSFSRRSTLSLPKGEVVGVDYGLMRSADEFKDQTYFIYNIKTEQLPHLLFPVGGMKKPAVRTLARKIGLPNAEKRESMGLCFVGKIRLKDFLEQKLKPKLGPIVLTSSEQTKPSPQPSPRGRGSELRVIGQHQGLYNYTIGQRQGIAVGGGGPYYVVKKDLKSNTLFVTNNPKDKALMIKDVQVHSVNWITGAKDIAQDPGLPYKQGTALRYSADFQLHGRYRHQGDLVPLTICRVKNDLYHVTFKSPQKAVASGQSLVLYKGKQCVGGGVIE